MTALPTQTYSCNSTVRPSFRRERASPAAHASPISSGPRTPPTPRSRRPTARGRWPLWTGNSSTAPTRVCPAPWGPPAATARSTPRSSSVRTELTAATTPAKRARRTSSPRTCSLHVAVSWWVMFCYNFHHRNRGLRLRLAGGAYLHRTPAMAMGLTDNPCSVADILTTQIVGFIPPHGFIPTHLQQHYISGPAL